MSQYRLVILSGPSGSGKSTALRALEDVGFFAVDNLPAPLIPAFIGYLQSLGAGEHRDIALLLDCRDTDSIRLLNDALKKLRALDLELALLFFDCHDEVIVRRFRETRRPHPLLTGEGTLGTITEALRKEREALSLIRAASDRVIDTSSFTPHDLRRLLEEMFQHEERETQKLELTFLSFGFKYGIPHDADLVLDVRFLPNPHFEPVLRERTGLDPDVVDYIFTTEDAYELVERYTDLLSFLVPRAEREGKRYFTVAVGCTGGKHRSVAIVMKLCEQLDKLDVNTVVRHRDKDRA